MRNAQLTPQQGTNDMECISLLIYASETVAVIDMERTHQLMQLVCPA